ncbi:MAG: Long-chain-fatty-acid--CoA ligase [Hyphomicrobiales bacterium]|jgi:fatty-acyl-CoA synthase|nr:Long-chain-fatty-acid--CoA ligase [Hyphomicrobiales bacterium]
MLTPSQRRQLLEDHYTAWHHMTIAQALDAAADRFPDRPLVITDDRSYTYRDIQEWSRAIGAGLIANGVRAGDHVAMVLPNFPAFVAIKFAIARIGAVAVPINYSLQRQELSYILDQSNSVALIIVDQLRERDYLADMDAIAPGWMTAGGGCYLPQLRHVFVCFIGGAVREGATSVDQLAQMATRANRTELRRRESDANPNLCSDVVYTSGTTGLPKGVMLTHDMILRAAYSSAYTRAFEDGRRILFSLPMYHVFGYVECLIASLFAGGAIIPQVVFDPRNMIKAVERHRASELVCVPTMTLKLLDVARTRSFDHSSVLAVFNSGGASPPSLWQDVRTYLGASEVMTAYGMTETTASTTCTLPEGPDSLLLNTNGKIKLCGIAAAGAPGGSLAQYKAVSPASGGDLPFGQPGELMVRGIVVTSGYYKKPEETAAAFTPDGWLHTGDVGVLDNEGGLLLTGRIKETYRCGGEMVMPKEIEDLLNTHPLVEQALVVGIPDPKMGEIGCICVIPVGDTRPDPQELLDLCTARLARFKIPRHVIFMTAQDVPLTATGRPQKFRLADLAVQRLAVITAQAS